MSLQENKKRIGTLLVLGWCAMVGAQQVPGTWKNVTDPGMKMSGDFINGPMTVLADRAKPGDIYVNVGHDGTWKSTDFGVTYTKVSTGINGDVQNSSSQLSAIIDLNPNRNPPTPPAIMVNQFGGGGLWKSANGGVDWTSVWDTNIYAADGVTNISSDVGGDAGGLMLLSTTGINHVLSWLHSYWGTGGNDGIFETTDGGNKWILHPTPGFAFQPHADCLFALDSVTWLVDHGYPAQLWRTTDAGNTWKQSTGDLAQGMGIAGVTRVGSALYVGSDFHDGIFKSTDYGNSWKKVPTPDGKISWIVATATRLYCGSGYSGDVAKVDKCLISNDASWTSETPGMSQNGAFPPGVMFDNTNYILIVPATGGGLWRYVEPAAPSTVALRPQQLVSSEKRASSNRVMILAGKGNPGALQSYVHSVGSYCNISGRIVAKVKRY